MSYNKKYRSFLRRNYYISNVIGEQSDKARKQFKQEKMNKGFYKFLYTGVVLSQVLFWSSQIRNCSEVITIKQVHRQPELQMLDSIYNSQKDSLKNVYELKLDEIYSQIDSLRTVRKNIREERSSEMQKLNKSYYMELDSLEQKLK